MVKQAVKDLLEYFITRGSDFFSPPRVGGGRARDPAMYTPFSKTKHQDSPFNFTVEGRKLGNLNVPSLISPSDIQGKTLYFTAGDRTSNQRLIEKVNDYLLENPKSTFGGPEYKDQINRGVWASEPTAMKAKENAFKEGVERGEDILTAYMPMGERSGDFSKHMAEVYGEMLRVSPIGSNSGIIFDDIIAKTFPKMKDIPSFSNKDQFVDWMVGLSGGKRAQLLKLFDTGAMKNLGVPDVSAARFAVTNPELIKSDALSVGYRFGVPEPNASMVKSTDHPSYGANLPRAEGTTSMKFEGELPFIIGARDTALPKAAVKNQLLPLPKEITSYMMNPRLRQTVDQQFVDEAETYLDLLKTAGKTEADLYTRSLLDEFMKAN
tara:strand:+ start:2032 stop:3168 length:1137 start_codon:yes stop_codon:yes gene_type:complete